MTPGNLPSARRPVNVLAALLLALCAWAAFPAFAGAADDLITYEDENDGIRTIKPDGSDEAEIRATGYGPRFSPDGKQIAFIDVNGGSDESVWTMSTDGSNPTAITPASEDFFTGALDWTPDGQTIVFSREDSIWSVPAAGGSETEISNPVTDLHDLPIVSADGSRIAYQDQDDYSIGLMGIGGGAKNDDATTPGIDDVDLPLDVTPDGDLLYLRVTTGDPDDTAEFRKIGFDGSDDASLGAAPNASEAAGYRYSPDGTQLVWDDEGDTDNLRIGDFGTAGTELVVSSFPGYPDWGEVDKTITVNETGDEADADTGTEECDTDTGTAGKQCTLRAAIETANANSGADEINFNITPSGRATISPTSALPSISEEVVIDATTQPGAPSGEPGIELDGGSAGNSHGLQLGAGSADSTIRGFDIHGFERTAIVVGGDGGHKLEGNWLGFEPGSPYTRDGNGSGIDVRSENVIIGGTTPEQRNIVSANGNANGAKAYVESLNGSDVSQATLHDTFAALGTGILISDGDASSVQITGNWIGPDPSGARFGEGSGLTSTFGVFVGPTAGISTDIQIGGETASPGTEAGNVITGNIFGVMALPDPDTVGVVDGLDIKGNLIGADPDGSAGSGLGGVFGAMIADHVAGVQIGGAGEAANRIQGQAVGVLGSQSTVKVQGNLIGTEDDLGDLVGGLSGTTPDIGLHNLIGVILGDSSGSLIGGTTPQLGNKLVGNLVGAIVGGQSSSGNAVLANTVGLSAAPPANVNVEDLDVEELGSLLGVVIDGGSNNDVGDGGAGNKIQANALGIVETGATGGHVQGNSVNGNVLGYAGAQVDDKLIGGTTAAQRNFFGGNVVGISLIGWAPTDAELELAHVGADNPVREQDRELAFEAAATQGPLNLVEATSSFPDAQQAVAFGDPPGTGSPAFGEGGSTRAARRASGGSRIAGNNIGITAGGAEAANAIGVAIGGDVSDTELDSNTIAHNFGGGVFVGNAEQLGSAIPEPTGIELVSNRIWDNYSAGRNLPGVAALGVDIIEPKPDEIVLQAAGVTDNDAGDADSGANGRQNFPVIKSALRQANGSVVVEGTINSKGSKSFQVQLFANERCNAFGGGEGELPIGQPFTVTTGAGGNASFTRTVQVAAAKPQVTANATGAEGTSEFSPCQEVADDPNPPDETDPEGEADGKGKNKAGGPTKIAVTSDEDGTVSASGTQQQTSNTKKRQARSATVTIAKKKKGKKGKKKVKKVKVKLGTVRKQIDAGQTLTLKLKPQGKKNKKAAKKLKKAVKKGAKAKAKLKVTFTDEAGNSSRRKLNLKLK